MSDTVKCVVTGEEGEALGYLPYPGELGKRIRANVSKAGWQQWLAHQTVIMNEYRLSPIDPKARKLIESEMEKFFFGGGAGKPDEYVPPADG